MAADKGKARASSAKSATWAWTPTVVPISEPEARAADLGLATGRPALWIRELGVGIANRD